MLTVTPLTDAEYVISSVALSIDEYYAGVGESPGVWAGRWAEGLGLAGVVEADELRALVDGKHPATGEDLLAGRPRKVRAFDLTFSAPKSVSLLWVFASDPVAEQVAAAHREAVEVALGFLEERAAVARVQSQGVRRRVSTEGWVVAGFVHRTSREGDPQLHTHCLVPNLVRRSGDGRHVAFDGAPMFDWAKAAGSVYQNHLQRTLAERLGVAWGPDRNNTREIDGFTSAQLRAFSKRSLQIETELEEKGAIYESPVLRMQADDEASLATRTVKDHSLTPVLLQARWQTEAEAAGLATGTVLEQQACWGSGAPEQPGWDEITARLVDPEEGLCAHSARFTKADVVEQLCAISGGTMTIREITAAADRFAESGLAVRLSPDAEPGRRRRAAEWSTAAHRASEDHTLALMDALAARSTAPVSDGAIEAALAAQPGLGDDQIAAVRVLAGEGGCLRAVLAPAGYGKTTMLHAAAQAAGVDGRPVVAVATTAKAVAELAGARLEAKTIARLRVDLSNGPLAAGTVVVLDEISQTPTAEVEAVLAAVDACPAGQIWVLGDPRQSQPVGAGGAAAHIEALADHGAIPSARLTVNRRQVDPADRQALDLLRHGDPAGSQALRDEHGWEHELATPGQTREAMAQAVAEDIGSCGAEKVVALVVSHTDAEDLADRIRTRLAADGTLTGPAMTGPGWTTEREYRAGDRVLLHARYGNTASRLVNGTTATITSVEAGGLTVRADRTTETVILPVGFVTGTRRDGSPNVSHAWARTVDGAQGGTWEACHLLGSSALDAYRGYTGQSRSRQPTHTWNTTRISVVDHGGILADQRDGAEQVADALRRVPDPTMAARSDPWTLDRHLRQLIAEHDVVLAGRSDDRSRDLADALRQLQPAETRLAQMNASVERTALRLKDAGPLSGLSRNGRHYRRELELELARALERADQARQRRDEIARGVDELRRHQNHLEQFDEVEGWRRDDIGRLRGELDHHWAQVITDCVRADDPLAFGIDKLRHARTTLAGDLYDLDASIPSDRSSEWTQERGQLPAAVRETHQAQQGLSDSLARLEDASRRRWGRQDHQAIAAATLDLKAAQQRAEKAAQAEAALRDRLHNLAEHKQQRRQVVADTAPWRNDLQVALAQVDGALDDTRPRRVQRHVEDPPAYLSDRLGAPPSTPAGQAVWCHHAQPIEAFVDRNDGDRPRWTGWSPQTDRTRREIALADRLLQTDNHAPDPVEWAKIADQAATLYKRAVRHVAEQRAAARRHAPFTQPEWTPGVETTPERRGPELSL